jgi:adenylylsulfate kinase-like enzyme
VQAPRVHHQSERRAFSEIELEHGKRATAVLWLFGPPGVGKSTVGWQIYRRLAVDGWGCVYLEIDQLGICYPEPKSDRAGTA